MSVSRLAALRGACLGAALAVTAFDALAHAATWIRGPYIQDLGSRGVAVLGELDTPHDATLTIVRGAAAAPSAGAVPSLPAGAPDGAVVPAPGPVAKAESTTKDATIELAASGLEPATSYRWSIALDDGTSADGTFTTAPEDDRPSTFVVYGDNRSNRFAHAAIVAAIRKTPADYLVNTGDMVYDGSQVADWREFFTIERDLLRERCLFPTIGNHEIAMPTSDGAQRYARMFRVPAPPDAAERWYTFRWGSARFFMVDAQDEFASGERAWLQKALEAADGEAGLKWRFVILHHGPYSSGLHGGNEAMIIAKVPELFRAHKVDVVFSGHDHIYERGDANGLRYVVTGGGGAPLYRDFRGGKTTQKFEATFHFLSIQLGAAALTMSTTRHDGSLIERCSLAMGGASGWACGGEPPAAAGLALGSAAPPSAPPQSTPSPAPPSRKSCGCALVSTDREWLGLVVAAALAATAALRPRGRRP